MGSFYVTIIFLGILLIIGSLFFIAMDKVNGKDFFKEFDRKKEEMFNLIQDSEDMIQELNKMSDYVVTMISEKNQEFFEKANRIQANGGYSQSVETVNNTAGTYTQPLKRTPSMPVRVNPVLAGKMSDQESPDDTERTLPTEAAGSTKAYTPTGAGIKNAVPKIEKAVKSEEETTIRSDNGVETEKISDIEEIPPHIETNREESKEKSDITERLKEADANSPRLVLNNKRLQVLKMIEQGMSNDEIADRLKIGKGEIGLIRGLSK